MAFKLTAVNTRVSFPHVHVQVHPTEGSVILLSQPGGEVAMRNSRDPGGPALIFSRNEMAAFLAGAKDGESDDYAG